MCNLSNLDGRLANDGHSHFFDLSKYKSIKKFTISYHYDLITEKISKSYKTKLVRAIDINSRKYL